MVTIGNDIEESEGGRPMGRRGGEVGEKRIDAFILF